MPVRIVQSKQNARVKELRRALAHPSREPGGLIGIEGPNLVAEALRARLHIHCIFAAHGTDQHLEALGVSAATDVLVMSSELLASSLATETPQPIAALVEPPRWDWNHLLDRHHVHAPLVVVLAGLQDPGNLGAIVRSAEAFGASGIVCLPGTVSEWNPKAVRASAGSVFRVPVMATGVNECFIRLREAGVTILSTAVRAARPAHEADLAGSVALLIGGEGGGVPRDLASRADAAVTVPCPGPVESLNAAVAAGVLLYEASRQREGRP